MLIGMVIGGAGKSMASKLQSNELLTHAGRSMYEAAIKGDAAVFRDAFEIRAGFMFSEGEGIGEGLIRIVKEHNVDQYAYAVGQEMAEQLASYDELHDMIEILERATSALRHAQHEREKCHAHS